MRSEKCRVTFSLSLLPGLLWSGEVVSVRVICELKLICLIMRIGLTIQVKWTRHAGHCRRSRDELISDILLWTTSQRSAKSGWPARTYIQQFCADTGCSLEDLPEVIDNREGWRERVRDIRADGATWWWWLVWVRFNGISIFIGYSMPKPFLRKKCSGTIQLIAGGIKRFISYISIQ